jgi:hypothetical protein
MAVTPATAADVTFSFSGIVQNIDRVDSDGNTIGGGQSFDSPAPFGFSSALNGSYTFTLPDPNLGNPFLFASYNPITHLTFQLGSYSNNSAAPLDPNDTFIGVLNGFGPLPLDAYLVSVPFSGQNVPGTINGSDPVTFKPLDIGIDVINSGLFPNNSLPSVPPDISAFGTSKTFRVSFGYGIDGDRVVLSGTLASLNLVATPLPPAVILFGAGLVALIGLGARNWQRARS